MKTYHNESGLTLLEVLLSIVILSIILVSVVNFFPQMGLMNKQNIDKQQAINAAKDVMMQWKDKGEEVRTILEDPSCKNSIEETCSFETVFPIGKNTFPVKITIKKTSDSGGVPEARQLQVQLLNKTGAVITETYGYVMLK